MNSTKKQARLAGLLWFLSSAAGGFSMSYVRSYIIVSDNAAATAANIEASGFFFRAALVSGLFSQIFLLFFGLALFYLFKEVSRKLSVALLVSVVVTVAIAMVNSLNSFAALVAVSQPDYLKVFSSDQLHAMALFFLRLGNGAGQGLVETFWTPYFFCFGLLVIKSQFLPKVLGLLLIVMSAGYAINILTKFLVPDFHPAVFTQLAMLLGALGGIPTILYLLLFGMKERRAIQP